MPGASHQHLMPGRGRIYALTDFDTTNILRTAAGAGLTCPDTGGWWMRVLCWITSQGVASKQRRVLDATNNDTSGACLNTNTSNNTFTCIMRATGTPVSPSFTVTSDMIGKLLDVVGVWDKAAGRLRLYVNGTEAGTGTATGATSVTNSGAGTCWGLRGWGASNDADGCAVAASEGGDGFTPTAAEILAAHVATRNRVRAGALPFAGISGKTTWRAQIGSAWDPPTSITAEVGGNMTMTSGAASGLTLTSIVAPVWAT